MTSWDPSPSPIKAHKWEGEEQNGKGIKSQEPGTPVPEDLIQEDESTSHCVLKINGAGHRESWSAVGGPSLCSLVEDWCVLPIP